MFSTHYTLLSAFVFGLIFTGCTKSKVKKNNTTQKSVQVDTIKTIYELEELPEQMS